jgi:hypothetical protein
MDASDDSDDGEDDDPIEKYQREETGGYQQSNSAANRPGALESSDHPSSSSARHRFQALVADIVNTHGLSRTQAMSLARQKDPTGYAAFNGRNATAKAAPSLLEQEMAKGVTAEIAKVRLMNLYGSAAELDRTLTKREETALAAEDALIAKAEDIFQNGELDRCASLRAARKQPPARLLKALQAS